MAKIITFSTKFPAYHPKAGQPTYFVEKILSGLLKMESKGIADAIYESGKSLSYNDVDSFLEVVESQTPKFHTIRAGHRFKAGDYFSPRIWSGKPYNSPQIVIAPDLKVEKVWNFEIRCESNSSMRGDISNFCYIDRKLVMDGKSQEILCKNDGLSIVDFEDWFKIEHDGEECTPVSFDGQIICWSKNVNY